ncbi:hypothetical protein D3C81_1829410 [compost metagenome]
MRGHQPTEAPAGHAEILGETVEHKGTVIDFQHADGIGAVRQAVIDLIHHQVTVAPLDYGGQPGQFVAGQNRAGRVGGRGHQGPDAVVIPVTLNQVRGQLITHVRPYGNKLRGAFYQA